MDLFLEDYEKGVSNIQRTFENSRQSKDIRLKNMQLVPLCPSLIMSTEMIKNEAQEQKKLNMKLEHRVVRGITNLDVKLSKIRGGETQTLREFSTIRNILLEER